MAVIRGFQYMPGLPGMGHITTGGYWHPGPIRTCPKGNCNPAPPAPTRGANLMSDIERVITVGYTKVDREAGYIPMADGYRPGAAQHVLTVTVKLSPKLADHEIAELVFIATNAPELDEGSPEKRIHDAIKATGYTGRESHWSLSVGDTIRVGGSPLLACGHVGFQPAEQVNR